MFIIDKIFALLKDTFSAGNIRSVKWCSEEPSTALFRKYEFGTNLHPVFLWYSFSKQTTFLPRHRSPNILSLNLLDKILCFIFMTQTYTTCPVHFTLLNFNFDNNIRLNTKYYEVHYAYSATSYCYPSTLYRSQIEVFLLDTSLSHTRRTRTMVYALGNRRKYYRRHLFSA